MPLPNFPPRQTPTIKRRMLQRREENLARALKATHPVQTLLRLAEEVRHAQLQVLKGRHKILEPAKTEEATVAVLRELERIAEDARLWQDMTAEEILSRYRKKLA